MKSKNPDELLMQVLFTSQQLWNTGSQNGMTWRSVPIHFSGTVPTGIGDALSWQGGGGGQIRFKFWHIHCLAWSCQFGHLSTVKSMVPWVQGTRVHTYIYCYKSTKSWERFSKWAVGWTFISCNSARQGEMQSIYSTGEILPLPGRGQQSSRTRPDEKIKVRNKAKFFLLLHEPAWDDLVYFWTTCRWFRNRTVWDRFFWNIQQKIVDLEKPGKEYLKHQVRGESIKNSKG
jgi:hypothetical protein